MAINLEASLYLNFVLVVDVCDNDNVFDNVTSSVSYLIVCRFIYCTIHSIHPTHTMSLSIFLQL